MFNVLFNLNTLILFSFNFRKGHLPLYLACEDIKLISGSKISRKLRLSRVNLYNCQRMHMCEPMFHFPRYGVQLYNTITTLTDYIMLSS